jgi:predicted NAD/FAD-dependent oxidoreductase
VGHPIAIIGGGLSGLVAARALGDAGRSVVLLERAGSLGGRLATRRVGGATFDHGAQFFTVRSDDFSAFVDELLAAEVAFEWCRGFEEVDGYPRYACRAGMDALAHHLGSTLAARPSVEVRTGAIVTSISPGEPTGVSPAATAGASPAAGAPAWCVRYEGADGAGPGELAASAVLTTAPVPESLALCDAGGVVLDAPAGTGLRALEYHRVLAVLARLDRPSAVPAPGAVQRASGPFSFVADNQAKGVSSEPALTLHVAHDLSRTRWDDDPRPLLADLLAEAAPWLGEAAVLDAELVRWRHSGPVTPWPDRACVATSSPGPLVFAGDAFGGPKVEGAFLAGRAAAQALLSS